MPKEDGSSTYSNEGKEITYFLTYLLLWITGLVVYLTNGKENNRMKFHSLQAILLGIVSAIIAIIFTLMGISIIGSIVSFFIWVYALYIGYQAYSGKDVKIPYLSGYASSHSDYQIEETTEKTEAASSQSHHSHKATSRKEENEELLKTLKKRWVNGEISKKKYLLMKKDIEEEE